jgi:hypothetical protein
MDVATVLNIVLGGAALAGLAVGGRAQAWKSAAQGEAANAAMFKGRAEAQELLAKERAATLEEERTRLARATARINELKTRPDLGETLQILQTTLTTVQERDQARMDQAVGTVLAKVGREHMALLEQAKKHGGVLEQIRDALQRQNGMGGETS